MKLFNSMTNQKEEFKSIIPNKISMYICGPTVYNYIHIGNARPMVVFDTFRRVFEQIGYEVKFMSNYTDVDDKIINAAKELNMSELDVANKFIEAYENDRKSLNTIMPEYRPRVTDYMDEIIAFIDDLIQKGYAYEVNGNVYFRISKLDEYGKLSNFNVEDLQVGARIEENKEKENPLDFVLWKKTEDGINWPTKWSTGRPGWHTECVVMIQTINEGEMIDIHGGGMDLKFPHHENEIAQAQGCCHNNIANYWIHNGFINVDDEKMSKSLGNVKWTKDVVSLIGPNVFRLAMMSTHYRSPLNFSDDLIETSKKELEKMTMALKQANLLLSLNKIENTKELDDKLFNEFMEYMQDDLNTPNGLKVIYEAVKEINQLVRSKNIDYNKLSSLKNTLEKMLEILGVFIELVNISQDDLNLYNQWVDAKEAKDFENADKYRQQLIDLNIL